MKSDVPDRTSIVRRTSARSPGDDSRDALREKGGGRAGSPTTRQASRGRKVPPELLRQLRNDVALAEVVVELQIPTAWRGRRFTFRCPACAGFRTAINRRVNLGRCFRCRRNFNPLDLVMAELGSPFLAAVAYLCETFTGRNDDGISGAQPEA